MADVRDQVTGVLAAIAAGEWDRARSALQSVPPIAAEARSRLEDAIGPGCERASVAESLGVALHQGGAPWDAINECFRASFYLSGRSLALADNPLYARFLANRTGTLLDKWVHYFPVYHAHLSRFRGRAPRVLEIGVYRGGGMALWQDYFGSAAHVVGIDSDSGAADTPHPGTVVLGDQADPDFLRHVVRAHGPFDVVIDDGGHTMNQQIVSVETLFPLMSSGGKYVVEDTHTSYWAEYADRGGDTFISWAKDRIDDLHAHYIAGGDITSVWATGLAALSVSDSIVVLDREDRVRPFSEIAGSTDFLITGRTAQGRIAELERERDALTSRLAAIEGQIGAPRPAGDPVSEELRIARDALADSRAQLGETSRRVQELSAELSSTQGRLLDAWSHITEMRKSTSWRITTPVRAAKWIVWR